ncbi:2-C-methyl-D-erythritol 4-phosphate cytidylyltransferase [Fibrisoma montanum]|uniref:2-C-methyl-D-erythritol 4-phosphate cytidylyltransferase n=1 Tax=Fibrisoma montanum TaxID=2305895 RepID=A0A418LX58_9BACT|nr:2-C-methyl-D-erythritol 4-phosphate cytidylyltransferase [Fibrisoma montanum]RIV17953.1 2-C-methyl-D-erythritol 4-phosphate cytidylyltransferase [Fibrisoma montanum]
MTHSVTDLPAEQLFAIIVAGGSGSRMKTDVPKQFLPLNGKPILQHTIERFLAASPTISIVLVLPERDRPTWATLCDQHRFQPARVRVVNGGATRFQSVRNGLTAILADQQTSGGLVAVHDGVRPFVSTEIIRTSFSVAAQTGSAVTCVLAKDSVRLVGNDGQSQAVDRSRVRLVQTPQTFQLDLFRRAFQVDEQPFFTDCASVVEHAGFSVTLIEGAYENIKITTPEDLLWAATFAPAG